MHAFHPDPNGFITNWIVSGVLETEIPEEIEGIKSDKPMPTFLRTIPIKEAIFNDALKTPETPVFGQLSALGLPWGYYQPGKSVFVDFSRFYSIRKKTEFYAACEIWADRDMEVLADIWHHPCVHMFLNKSLVYSERHLRHFPIHSANVTLKLQKGKNELFVRVQGLGVIVLNNLFAVQLQKTDGITIALSGDTGQYDAILATDRWLWSLKVEKDTLIAPTPPSSPVLITHSAKPGNWEIEYEPKEIDGVWEKGTTFDLGGKYTRVILKTESCGQMLSRRFELDENIMPRFDSDEPSDRSAYEKAYMQDIANTGDKTHYAVLARYLIGAPAPSDPERILSIIKDVESRKDCSDFDLSFLLRLYIHCGEQLDDTLKAKIKSTILGFRYWMDEPGVDTMAMVTENHSLLFQICQRTAGLLFKNEIFTCSGRTGREQSEIAALRIQGWLNEKERDGLHEFNSATYIPITVAALLMIVDHAGDQQLESRAAALLDKIFENLALHTFKGVVFAPQGRMYRVGIYPYTTPIQGMLSFVSPDAAVARNPWMSAMYCSAYRPPQLKWDDHQIVDTEYVSAGAKIKVFKTDGYILTSIAVDENSGMYQAGQILDYEHQEHLWMASIGADCPVFVNHPSTANDLTRVRPGFWYGNGVTPWVRQVKNTLSCDYVIPNTLPIHFTHCHFPKRRFDRCVIKPHFLFGQKDDSYIAVWCSLELSPADDVLTGCEFRAYGSVVKWKCRCSDKKSSGTFESFIKAFETEMENEV